jgi:hypothetical protein
MKDDRLYLIHYRVVKNEPFSTVEVPRLRGAREKPPKGGTPNRVPSAFQQPFKRAFLKFSKNLRLDEI